MYIRNIRPHATCTVCPPFSRLGHANTRIILPARVHQQTLARDRAAHTPRATQREGPARRHRRVPIHRAPNGRVGLEWARTLRHERLFWTVETRRGTPTTTNNVFVTAHTLAGWLCFSLHRRCLKRTASRTQGSGDLTEVPRRVGGQGYPSDICRSITQNAAPLRVQRAAHHRGTRWASHAGAHARIARRSWPRPRRLRRRRRGGSGVAATPRLRRRRRWAWRPPPWPSARGRACSPSASP